MTDDKKPEIDDAAKRALEEAAARRKDYDEAVKKLAKEEGGRKSGPEATRYGDWEKKGIISDF